MMSWLDGGRIETHAWLHLAGWCLARGWSRGEVASLLVELDRDELDEAKRREHWHVLGNARAIDAPGGFREWASARDIELTDGSIIQVPDVFAKVDEAVNDNPARDAFIERRNAREAAERFADTARVATDTPRDATGAATTEFEISGFADFLVEAPPIKYVCEDLGLALNDDKISFVMGYASKGRGPFADYITVCLAYGIPILGRFPCEQTRMLTLDYEGFNLTWRRFERIAKGLGRDPRELKGLIYHPRNIPRNLSDQRALDAIAEAVETYKIGGLLLDSYTRAAAQAGLDATQPDYANIASDLAKVCPFTLGVAHINKGSMAKGKQPETEDLAYSQALAATSQTLISLHLPDPTDKYLVQIGCARAPEGPLTSFRVRFIGDKDEPLQVVLDGADNQPLPKEVERMRDRIATIGSYADKIEHFLAEHPDTWFGITAIKDRICRSQKDTGPFFGGMHQAGDGYARARCQPR